MIPAGARVNTLIDLKLTNIYITDTEVTFTFDEVLKHSEPGYKQKPFVWIHPDLYLSSLQMYHKCRLTWSWFFFPWR